MDKTILNEETLEKNKNSVKAGKEIRVAGKMADALKREREEFAKRQGQRGVKVKARSKIRSVSLAKDLHGRISVQVNMEDGARLFDNAKEKNVDKFKKRAESVYRRSKIEELLKKIKEYGYAAVEGEIPAELKEAVLKSMEKANISTSYKGEKAEAEAARQAAQNAADNGAKAALAFGSRPTTPNMQAAYNDGRLKYPSLPTYLSKESSEFFMAREYEKHRAIANILAEPAFKNAYVEHSRLGSPAITLRREIPDANGNLITVLDKGSIDDKRGTAARNDVLVHLITKDPATLTKAEKDALAAIKEKTIQKCHLSKDISDEEWKDHALKLIASKGFGGELAPIMKQLQKGQTSPETKAFLNNLETQTKKDTEERLKKEKANKIEQMNCALSNENGLTEDGKKLRTALLAAGITLEDLKKADGNEKIEALLKQNNLFLQSEGSFPSTCLQSYVDQKNQANKEALEKVVDAVNGKGSEEVTYQDLLDATRKKPKGKLREGLSENDLIKLGLTSALLSQFADETGQPKDSIVLDKESGKHIEQMVEEYKGSGTSPYEFIKECFPDGFGRTQAPATKGLGNGPAGQKTFLSNVLKMREPPQSSEKTAHSVAAKETAPRKPTVSKEQKDAQKAAAKAQKEALLDPNNSESAEKIRQAKAVLEKENKGEELTEREKQLSDFIHRTYKNIENLKPSDLDDPKNTKQLAQVLQCKKLFSGKPKETVAPSKNAEKVPPVNNGVEKQPAAVSQPKQQTQSNETEADRVKNKIKENMQTYRASSEKAVAPAKQKAGKVGLQQKIQQEAKNPNTSSRQQAPSPAVQAALLKRKEGQGR